MNVLSSSFSITLPAAPHRIASQRATSLRAAQGAGALPALPTRCTVASRRVAAQRIVPSAVAAPEPDVADMSAGAREVGGWSVVASSGCQATASLTTA